jgi:hypothetical protein
MIDTKKIDTLAQVAVPGPGNANLQTSSGMAVTAMNSNICRLR